MDDELILTDAELASALWKRLRQHLEGKLERLRVSNDNELDPIATARLRGRIAEIRTMLKLGMPDTE